MPYFTIKRMNNVEVRCFGNRYVVSCEYEGARYSALLNEHTKLACGILHKDPLPGGHQFSTRSIKATDTFGANMIAAMSRLAEQRFLFVRARNDCVQESTEARREMCMMNAAKELYAALVYVVDIHDRNGFLDKGDIANIKELIAIANGDIK
jgi:hypothetical protein